jgi:hypothetical protein
MKMPLTRVEGILKTLIHNLTLNVMSLNTSLLIIPNNNKNIILRAFDIFDQLGYSAKQLTDYVSYDDSHKWISQYVKAISVSYDENNIIFDDYTSQLGNPHKLLQMSTEVESSIFYVTQSETTEIWSYDIFKNGKYCNISRGTEIDFDFGFKEDENIIVESAELAPLLNDFIETFKFDSLFERYYWDFEVSACTDLKSVD